MSSLHIGKGALVMIVALLMVSSLAGPLLTYGLLSQRIGALEERLSMQPLTEGDVQFIRAETDMSDVAQSSMEAVVSVLADNSQGSGVFVDARGYILTNRHVIENSRSYTVVLSDGSRMRAELVYVSDDHDLAVLRVDRREPFPTLGFSDDVRLGMPVLAIGNPQGLQFSVSQGIISNTERSIRGTTYLQTDVSINPGNSGGPLVDSNGSIVGINTLKLKDTEGLGFAIPARIALSEIARAIPL